MFVFAFCFVCFYKKCFNSRSKQLYIHTIMVCTPKSEVLPNLSIILPPQKTKFGIYYSYIYLQIFFLLHQFIINVLSVSSSYLISIDPKIMSFIVFTS